MQKDSHYTVQNKVTLTDMLVQSLIVHVRANIRFRGGANQAPIHGLALRTRVDVSSHKHE